VDELNERQKQLKHRFTAIRGYWSEEAWGDVLKMAPDFLEAYLNFSGVPWDAGPLSPVTKELIYLAIDASATHLDEKGIRIHMHNALKNGASKEAIVEVLELVSVLGIHACEVGMPLLFEAIDQDTTTKIPQLDEWQKQLKNRFMTERGYWAEESWGRMLTADPDFFEAYLNFSAIPWQKGSLPPKTRELIYLAIDASTTHLYVPGIKIHVHNSLMLGATAEEIIEVFELVSVLGIHTCIGFPILSDEMKKVVK
jgi:alkylhydroperoxidase/carboxymuconolactone decarboxylase family protein YurZ